MFQPPPHYTGANQMFGYRTMSASLSVGRSSLWTMNTLTTHTHTHTHTKTHTRNVARETSANFLARPAEILCARGASVGCVLTTLFKFLK